jgi:diaminopimelate epimerase
MRIRISKMHGAGNDFVVLDETRGLMGLTPGQYRYLADRHFGVGADQILSIRQPSAHAPANVDFSYVIHNQDGSVAQHCGNGARCFARYVRDKGLTTKPDVVVQTVNRILTLTESADGLFQVDMDVPVLGPTEVAFDTTGLVPQMRHGLELWPLALVAPSGNAVGDVQIGLVSMGNPHAVCTVQDSATTEVGVLGPLVSRHARFKYGVNAGFMQVIDRGNIRLRVYERGAGETLACGSGACAAVVAGIAAGALDAQVRVQALGGELVIEWAGAGKPVLMRGPAQFVFDADIELPDC